VKSSLECFRVTFRAVELCQSFKNLSKISPKLMVFGVLLF